MPDAPRRLKVLLIAYHFPPANNGGVQRPLQMWRLLPRFGVDVCVVTQRTSFWPRRAEPNVIRVWDTNSTGLGKAIHYPARVLQHLLRRLGASTSWHGWWSASVQRRWRAIFESARPDVVLSTYPPVETLDTGLYLSRKFNVPLVADFRDGLLFEPVEAGMLQSASTRRRYERLEAAVARNAAAILTVSDPISAYFEREYEHPLVRTVPNGFDPEAEWIDPSPEELDPSECNLVYTGRLGLSERGRRSPALFVALTRLADESPGASRRLRVHFVGELTDGERAALSGLTARGIVRDHGLLPRARAIGFQRAATVLLLVTAAGKTSVATSKLFEYLSAGRPILGLTRGTAAADIIRRTGAGLLVDPDDADAIHDTLRRLMLEPGFLAASVHPVQREIDSYSRPRQMEGLAKLLRQVVAGSPGSD